MTPAELTTALEVIGRAIDGDVAQEERAAARAALREIRGLLRDVRTGPDDVAIGRQVPVFRPSPTLVKLQALAPKGALDGVLRWVESQAGTRGRRTQDFTLVTDEGTWTQVREHQPPVVYRRA